MKFRYKFSTNIEKSALKNRKKCEQTALSCNRLRRTVLQHSSSSKNEAGGETMRGREDLTYPVITENPECSRTRGVDNLTITQSNKN